MFIKGFWKDAFERTIATFAQTLIPLIGANVLVGMNWWAVLGVALSAALLALLKAIAASYFGENNAGFVNYEYEPKSMELPDDEGADDDFDWEPVEDEFEDVVLNPPDPIVLDDGEVEWPQDPDFVPFEIEEVELEPVEDDEDGEASTRL